MAELRDPRLESLEENLELCRAALRTRDTPAEARIEPDPYSAFSNDDLRQAVAEGLVGLYQVLPQRSFLDEAIELYEDVLTRRPVGDCQRTACLLNLSTALHWRWKISGQADEDLHRSIGLLRNALKLSLSEASRDLVLNNLANTLWTSYQRQGSRDVLLEAIDLHREALLLRPVGSVNRTLSLCNLADTLHTDYQAHGDANALEEAELRYREALKHHPTFHPADRDLALSGLARVLKSAFKLRGDRNILNEAVQLHREAFAIHSAGHPRRNSLLNNLANVLEIDWTHFGSYDALTEALKHRREALQLLPEGHADRAVAVSGLARTIYESFQRNGDTDSLQEAIALFREKLSALPLSHWARSSSLHSLATALLDSCQKLGNLNHLAESIGLLREALLLCPPGNPRREDCLNSLANALHTRFIHQDDSEVLSEAITLYEEALEARPPGHLSRIISLNNLAGALLSSFRQSQDSDTLAEVIHLYREALALCSDKYPMRPKALRNLAVALQLSCLHNCTTDAVKEIISLHREALCMPVDPGRYVSLLNLGATLFRVASHTHNSQTWAQVLPLFQEALQCCPVDHPMRSDLNRNIGRCLLKTDSPIFDFPRGIGYLNDDLGDDLAPAKERLMKAAEDLRCVEDAWDYAVKSADQEVRATVEQSVLRLYRKAIMLLPRMANFGLDHNSRFRTLLGSDEISRTAATRAVLVGLGVEAIEMLEEGRGIFWARALHLRTTDLKDVPQQDCLELQRIFNILERSAHSSNVSEEMPEERERTLETRRQLNIQAEALISRIRAYPGLQRFLMPPAFAMLAQSLLDGYVVIINTSRLGCHALLLSKGGGLSTSLGLNPPSGGFYSERIRGYLPRDMGSSYSDPAPICTDVATESRSLRISSKTVRSLDNVLAILWSSVVKPVINSLSLQRAIGGARPRVWWCVTGELTFLPIHAAGIYGGDDQDCASDYVVSSYVPSLSALAKARNQWSRVPCRDISGLLFGEPSSGHNRLVNVDREVYMVRACFEETSAQVLNPPSFHTSLADIQTYLSRGDSHILHLACHGDQAAKPLESAFLLQDGQLTLADIMRMNLPQAVLAFLSACWTAKGDEKAPDQAVHLAASMLFCGFRSVVGTMWRVGDEDAPEVALNFYKVLLATGHLDLDDIPYALDAAVSKLRDTGAPAESWALFVHMGG